MSNPFKVGDRVRVKYNSTNSNLGLNPTYDLPIGNEYIVREIDEYDIALEGVSAGNCKYQRFELVSTESEEIQVGDTVECIDDKRLAHYLLMGQYYEVVKIDIGTDMIKFIDPAAWFNRSRFKKVTKGQKPAIQPSVSLDKCKYAIPQDVVKAFVAINYSGDREAKKQKEILAIKEARKIALYSLDEIPFCSFSNQRVELKVEIRVATAVPQLICKVCAGHK